MVGLVDMPPATSQMSGDRELEMCCQVVTPDDGCAAVAGAAGVDGVVCAAVAVCGRDRLQCR